MTMSREIYRPGGLSFNPYVARRPVRGRVVAVMEGRLEDRGLELIAPPSRALRQGEIHELIATDETAARPGQRVDRISYLGFFEVTQGGVVLSGDPVRTSGRHLGQLAGFDLTHFPNHLNIVIFDPARSPGATSLSLGAEIIIGADPDEPRRRPTKGP